MRCHGFDVEVAHLCGGQEEGINLYAEVPEGWTDDRFAESGTDWKGARNKFMMRVTGNWYGTKQAGRQWMKEATRKFGEQGLTQSQIEGCVFFVKQCKSGKKELWMASPDAFEEEMLKEGALECILSMWVDDGFGGVIEEKSALNRFKIKMHACHKEWGIKLEGVGILRTPEGKELRRPRDAKDIDGAFSSEGTQYSFDKMHLGVQVRRRGKRVSLSQEKYLTEVLERAKPWMESKASRKRKRRRRPCQ